jgi:hypothetical protein
VTINDLVGSEFKLVMEAGEIMSITRVRDFLIVVTDVGYIYRIRDYTGGGLKFICEMIGSI